MLKLISHPSENNIPEKKLTDHLENVAKLSKKAISEHNISPTLISKDNLQRLDLLISIFHDFGKSTTWFQDYIRNNRQSNLYTSHSLVSAIVAYHAIIKEFDDRWAYMGFQIILKHHSNLGSYEVESDNFNLAIVKKQIEDIKKNNLSMLTNFFLKYNINIGNLLNNLNLNNFKVNILEESDDFVTTLSEHNIENAFEFFFINNYLFSLLVDFDKKDAARLKNSYFDGNLIESEYNVFSYLTKCYNEYPEKFSPDIPINKFRNQFLKDIDENKDITPNNHFYSITAPTGIGKTFGCMVFANKLKSQLPEKKARLIYALPYTSIIEQNFNEFEKIISFNLNDKYFKRPTRYLMKHHYLTPKIIVNRNDHKDKKRTYKDYLDDRLFVESWESSMVVTTFVQLLHTIFGFQNKFLKKFHNIINSLVILDEVQNIDPNYHKLIQNGFNVLADVFNIYFLLVTATQPKIFPKERIVEIIKPNKYMKVPTFNRVKLSVNKTPISLEVFANEFSENFSGVNCLIVMNTKGIAIDFYNSIKERFKKDYKIFCLTTFLTPYDRNRKISEIRKLLKNNEKVIVISTQLVEAGVDLSFKKVYRDFGPLDSIIQVAGRCNRNGEFGDLGGDFQLINLSNSGVYSKNLIQYSQEVLINKEYESSNFLNLSENYFSFFQFELKSNWIINAIKEMNYDIEYNDQIPVSKFKVIPDTSKRNIYLLHTKEAEQKMKKLLQIRNKIKSKDNKVGKDKLLIELEKLKFILINFKISLYPNQLKKYEYILEPKEEISLNKDFCFSFISNENCKKYVYNNEIGFLINPRKELPDFLII